MFIYERALADEVDGQNRFQGKEDEAKVVYSPESAVANQAHPLRVGLTVVAKQPEIRQPQRGGRRGGRGGRF